MEREFEGLYDRYIKAPGLAEGEHRAMLMVCLSIATHRILSNEVRVPTQTQHAAALHATPISPLLA